MQEIPDATKQAKWSGPSPPKFDWDKEIKRVVEEGKEVPEIEWLKPGEDAAWEVFFHFHHRCNSMMIFLC